MDFIDFIDDVDPKRLVFTDEKPLKGMDIFGKKVRRHPITGEVPTITANADLRNRYFVYCNLYVFCLIYQNLTKLILISIVYVYDSFFLYGTCKISSILCIVPFIIYTLLK